jgi:hypothetical protein
MTERTSQSEIRAVEAAFFALTLFLGGLHIYLAFLVPEISEVRSEQFLLIGVAFFAGVLVRGTPLWRPVLYLLAAAFGVYLNVLWLLGSAEPLTIGLAAGGATTLFILLAIYLFVRTESRAVSA